MAQDPTVVDPDEPTQSASEPDSHPFESERSPWQAGRRLAPVAFAATIVLTAWLLLSRPLVFVNSQSKELWAHVVSSAALTLAMTGLLLAFMRKQPSVAATIGLGSAATVVLEVAQRLTATRQFEIDDVLAGFAGVLLTAWLTDMMIRRWSRMTVLNVHALTLTAGSIVMFVLLVTNLGSNRDPWENADIDCPVTVAGQGERLTIDQAPISGSCVTTESGGLGLLGAGGATELQSNTVLATSNLDGLVEQMRSGNRIVLRAGFTTQTFGNGVGTPGAVAILESASRGQVILIQTRDARLEVFGPRVTGANRSGAMPQVLVENTTYTIEVELDEIGLRTWLDGQEVGFSRVDPTWHEKFEEDDLRLYIGNSRNFAYPVEGVVEWIEIDS